VNVSLKRAACFAAVTLVLLIAVGRVSGQSAASADDAPPMQENSTFLDGAAGGPGMPPKGAPAAQQPLSDLTLGNFFSEGWDDAWAVRHRATGTPDYPLLRVQTNELLRLLRMNFFEQSNLNSPTRKNLVDADAFIDWAFNRRFMIEVDAAHQWIDTRPGGGSDFSGDNSYFLTRFKLIDTEASACTFNFKVTTPNYGIATNDTQFTYAITGFEDMAYWLNLERVGLYYTVCFDTLAGPAAAGAQRNDMQYDISVAKTITAPNTGIFRDLTLFEENFAQTLLDGPTAGRTFVTMTPGLRFNFGTCDCWKMGNFNALILGVDLPVTSFQPWSETWRLSYIKVF
jgi:hypothetical protein